MKSVRKDVGQVKVRLASPLKAWLHDQAATAKRSLSSEIEMRLEATFKRDSHKKGGQCRGKQSTQQT